MALYIIQASEIKQIKQSYVIHGNQRYEKTKRLNPKFFTPLNLRQFRDQYWILLNLKAKSLRYICLKGPNFLGTKKN